MTFVHNGKKITGTARGTEMFGPYRYLMVDTGDCVWRVIPKNVIKVVKVDGDI